MSRYGASLGTWLAILVVASCARAAAESPPGESERLEPITRAFRSFVPIETPPPENDPAWTPVALPDAWLPGHPHSDGPAWYRLTLPQRPEHAAERWAVYLPQVNMNAEVFVGDESIGSGGRMRPPLSRNWNRPLFFPFPSDLLADSDDPIVVRIAAYSYDHGRLGHVFVGPESRLIPVYERQHFLQVFVPQATTLLALVVAVYIGVLWLVTNRELVYGYFAVSALLWAAVGLNYWVRDIPVSHWTWARFSHFAIDTFVASLAFWVHRLVEIERPRLERGLLVFIGLALLAVVLVPPRILHPVGNSLHAISLAIGAYCVLTLARHLRQFAAWEACFYIGGGGVSIALALHDLSAVSGLLSDDWVYLMPYVGPIVLLSFATTLTTRFATSQARIRRINLELGERVEQKARELEANFERMRQLEQDQLLAGERERIMREMHDGLGAQLISTLALVESGEAERSELATALRNALDDMRVVIDSLDPDAQHLGALLGAFRGRIEPMLRRGGLELEWRVTDLSSTPDLAPEQHLHVLRILQEAVTNVVKHAQASRIRIGTELRSGGRVLALVVDDDGIGLPAAPRNGRGFANMYARARALDGRLEVNERPRATGVTVRLEIGLATANEGLTESGSDGSCEND